VMAANARVPVLATSPGDLDRDRPVAMQSEILRAFQSSRQNAAKSLAGEGAPRAFAGTGPEFGLDVVSGANGEQQLRPGGSRAASAFA